MKKLPGRRASGINLSPVLDRWIQARDMSRRQLARAVGMPYSTINGYASGRLLARQRKLDLILAALDVDMETFLSKPPNITPRKDEPLVEHIPAELCDDTNDEMVVRIFKALCRGCQRWPRGCNICETKRFMQLCSAAVNGKLDIDSAIERAESLEDECVQEANRIHDNRTFMSCGHAGRQM